MDLERYAEEYKYVSRNELERIRQLSASDMTFESKVRCLNMDREKEKIHGKRALRPGPLVHVLSVRIKPKEDGKIPLVVYGSIYAEHFDSTYQVVVGHHLYKCDRNHAQALDTSASLTLNGPDFACHPCSAIIPMFRNKINVELFDETDNAFAQGRFCLDDSELEGGYEQVKSTCIPCGQVSLVVDYVAIPFGLNCRIKIRFHSLLVPRRHDSMNVTGKIVASCAENYTSEKCVLFQKQSTDFERVEIDGVGMQLSRCWMALPAYSSIMVGLDLSEFETGRSIVNDTVQLIAKPGSSGERFVLGDVFIQLGVSWFPPTPLGCHEGYDCLQPQKVPLDVLPSFSSAAAQGIPEIDDMDTEEYDEHSSADDADDSLSNPDIPWELRAHRNRPSSSPAIEIFSIFIGKEKSKAIQVHGSIEILSENVRVCYIFKRDRKDALFLSEHMNTASVLDGSRLYEDYNDLELKVDVQDAEGSLAIKGYAKWDAEILDSLYRDKQLCSFFQGQNGFVAVHYSIFSNAVLASPKIYFNLKRGSVDKCPMVYGNIISQYCNHYYSSRYHKDFYRSVLFMKTRGDVVSLSADGLVPLSRPSVVVPTYSPLIVNVNLSTSTSKMCSMLKIEIGDDCKTVETDDYMLRIEVDWREIK